MSKRICSYCDGQGHREIEPPYFTCQICLGSGEVEEADDDDGEETTNSRCLLDYQRSLIKMLFSSPRPNYLELHFYTRR